MNEDVARTNWAGNLTFSASAFHRPTSIPELQRLVAGSDRIRALGTGHSFNEIADTTGDLVSTAGLPRRIEIDADQLTATVSGAVRYGELAVEVHAAGVALANMGSLPHISVAGAVATGTHGSGLALGNLATAVRAIDIVTAGGDLVHLSREANGDQFDGMVVSLGLLGVVTTLTLDLVPTFEIRQDLYTALPEAELLDHSDLIFGSGYSVSVFSTWAAPRTHNVMVKRQAPVGDVPSELLRATRVVGGPQGLAGGWTEHGTVGPWHQRLPHFRLDATPSVGEELQSEFLIGRSLLPQALVALADIADDIGRIAVISELRTVAADHLWLSPSYLRDSACIHFTCVPDTAAVDPVIREIERLLAPFDPRPHWGKVNHLDAAGVRLSYDRLADFQQLLTEYDPTGKFHNDLTRRLFS